jgi:SAM-dependent methyltransferase
MGYGSETLLARYAPYADRFTGCGPVVDLGCGRGEFLELLKQRGIEAIGVDADEGMVRTVRAKGLEAQQSEVHEFLRSNEGRFGGVFAAHLIEHFSADGLVDFTRQAVEALRPGGRLIVVTPNPRNLSMQLYEFWTDLQHVRFYTPEIVRLVLQQSGLGELEVGENSLYLSVPRAAEYSYVLGPPQVLVRRRSRLKRRFVDWMLPPWVFQMREILRSYYPPAEFFVTGVR